MRYSCVRYTRENNVVSVTSTAATKKWLPDTANECAHTHTASHAHLNHVITRVIARQTRPTHRRQRCARQHARTHTVSHATTSFVAHHPSSSSSSITARTVGDGIHARARIAERVYRLAHARHPVVRVRHIARGADE